MCCLGRLLNIIDWYKLQIIIIKIICGYTTG